MVVDLHAPLGPRKPSTSPLATVRSIPDTAVIAPNFLVRPWMMIMAAGGSKGPCDDGCVPLEKSLLRRKRFLVPRVDEAVTPARATRQKAARKSKMPAPKRGQQGDPEMRVLLIVGRRRI